MQVILQKEVVSLGREGDIVKVAGGYANNYLIPKGLAVIATSGNLKQLELRRKAIARREQALKTEARSEAAKLEGKSVVMKVKSGTEGRLYGSITTKDIAGAIEEQLAIVVDRRRIQLAEPIKQVGNVTVKVRLYPEIEAVLEIKVSSDAVGSESAESGETEAPEEAPNVEAQTVAETEEKADEGEA